MAAATQQSLAVIPAEMAIQPTATMNLMQYAISQGAGIDVIERLVALKEREEANEARKAFDSAMSQCKASMPRIVKNISVTNGPLAGRKYADLWAAVDVLTPHLSKHDLSASWKITKDEPNWIEVTCSIRHKLGHSESVSMGGPPDAGGAKNPIQARASTVSYLERYTLLAATGTAASGVDNDGNGAAQQMPDHLYDEWLAAIQQAPNRERLQIVWKQAMAAADEHHDQDAKKKFIDAKDKAKGAL
jgi:hypothetical protein